MFRKEGQYSDTGELEALYLELGYEYYKSAFEDPIPQLLPLFDRITRMIKEKEKTVCKQCGAELTEGSMFCHKCGCPVDDNKITERLCGKCGNILEMEAVFCNKCGSKL